MPAKKVTLGEWLAYYDIDWESGLCVNIATDGLDPLKDHLLAVGCQFPGEQPEYVYVRGGYPMETEQYHGITLEKYGSSWVGVKRAQEILRDIVQDAQFLVVGNRGFFNSWQTLQEPPLSAFGDYPAFGLMEYAKLLHSEPGLYTTIGSSVEKIASWVAYNVRDMRYHGGYSMRSLYSRIVGESPSEEGILFENQTRELTRLYCAMLWA